MVFRFVAAVFYDCLAIFSLFFLFTALCLFANHNQAVPPHTLWYQASLASMVIFYYLGSLKYGHQTLGMRAWRLKVISGKKSLSIAQGLSRFFLFVPACLFSLLKRKPLQEILFQWTQTRLIDSA